MSITLSPEVPPLREDQDGTIRVGSTRVTLESVLWAYREGSSPEQIHSQFPSVEVADIFAVIAYYLRHRSALDEYLAEREAMYVATAKALKEKFPQEGLRAGLLARRKQ